MFYRLKPKVILINGMPLYTNDEYEQAKLKTCPKSPDRFGPCPYWNEGEGSQECCGCLMAEWSVVDV